MLLERIAIVRDIAVQHGALGKKFQDAIFLLGSCQKCLNYRQQVNAKKIDFHLVR
jgi:hypothetical protein